MLRTFAQDPDSDLDPAGMSLENLSLPVSRRVPDGPDVSDSASSDLTVREQLSSLKALVALGLVMTATDDEDQIVAIATAAIPSLGPWRSVGVHLEGAGWTSAGGSRAGTATLTALESRLAGLTSEDDPVDLGDGDWGRAFPIHSFGHTIGHLVVGGDDPGQPGNRYLLATLAQQMGSALTTARSRTKARATAATLRDTNDELSATVTILERRDLIHERLMQVETRSEGEAGIAAALHELIGLPVAIEDQHGNLRAWSGPGRPDPYPKAEPARRQRLLRRARREGRPIRDGDRVLAVTRSNSDSIGVVVVLDPERTLEDVGRAPIDASLTVLSVELARLRGIEDTQLRLGLGLFDDLLAGHDEEESLSRAHALGYDLQHPHRVAVVRANGMLDELLQATRRVVAEAEIQSLVGVRRGEVTILAPEGTAWDEVCADLTLVVEWSRCRLGVGGVSSRPGDVPRSFDEATFALDVGEVLRAHQPVTAFDELGLLRVLAHIDDVRRMQLLMVEQLGPLLDYDAHKGSELVLTLATYLEHGGAYRPTSEELNIHRNTLKYRLGRIRDIAAVDPSDPHTAFDLQVATRIWQTLSSTVHEPGSDP